MTRLIFKMTVLLSFLTMLFATQRPPDEPQYRTYTNSKRIFSGFLKTKMPNVLGKITLQYTVFNVTPGGTHYGGRTVRKTFENTTDANGYLRFSERLATWDGPFHRSDDQLPPLGVEYHTHYWEKISNVSWSNASIYFCTPIQWSNSTRTYVVEPLCPWIENEFQLSEEAGNEYIKLAYENNLIPQSYSWGSNRLNFQVPHISFRSDHKVALKLMLNGYIYINGVKVQFETEFDFATKLTTNNDNGETSLGISLKGITASNFTMLSISHRQFEATIKNQLALKVSDLLPEDNDSDLIFVFAKTNFNLGSDIAYVEAKLSESIVYEDSITAKFKLRWVVGFRLTSDGIDF
jgi:hypothetical protein